MNKKNEKTYEFTFCLQLIDETVRMHETDPLTRDWFGPSKFRNFGHHAAVYNAVSVSDYVCVRTEGGSLYYI